MDKQGVKNGQEGYNIQINTRLLMITSAIFMGTLGLIASFLPQEITGFYCISTGETGALPIKILGALYLGFAAMNWMARGNIIGGIYSRQVAVGNFFHFFMITIVLLKHVVTVSAVISFIKGSIIYAVFAICFGYILFAGGKACT